MVDRLLQGKIKGLPKSILLLGPRQVGKSTLLRGLKPDLIVDLSLESEFFRFSTQLDLLERIIDDVRPERVLIDEIQRIPEILNTIQSLLDTTKRRGEALRFLLSGSSARKLRRGHANLLPGRVFTYNLSGICAKEVEYDLNPSRALRFGFLPEPFFEERDDICEKLLTSYSATYLREEIQAESLSRNIQGFARFLNVIAATAGQVLDFSKVSSRAKISRTSCVRFVEILEDTLVAHRISIFDGISNADVIKHPKLYFFDVGVLNGLLQNFNVSADRVGHLFEHLVYNQIRNSAFAHDVPCEIFFFRTRHGLEVDFIVRINGKVWAIEAKAGAIDDGDLQPLRAFRDYFPGVAGCIAVTLRQERRWKSKDGIVVGDTAAMLREIGF